MSDMDYGDKTFIANLTAGLLIFILNVRFSVAYYSYFWIGLALYLIYSACHYRYYKGALARVYQQQKLNLKILGGGIVACYGMLLSSSFLLLDKQSAKTTMDWFLYVAPLVVFWILSGLHNIDRGLATGLLLAVLANAILVGMQIVENGTVWSFCDAIRVIGTFENPNTFGAVLAWMIPFLIYFFYRVQSFIEKTFCLLGFFLSNICLYMTHSRGAAISLIAGFLLLTLLYGVSHRLKLGFKRNFIVLILCGILLVWLGLGSIESTYTRGMGERQLMWSASVQMWEDHKILGTGIGRWTENYYSERYHPVNGHEKNHYFPHNMFLYFLAGAGLLGAIGYICLVLSMFWVLLRKLKADEKLTVAIPMTATFIAFILVGMVDSTLTNKMVALPYFALMGYSVGSYDADRKES